MSFRYPMKYRQSRASGWTCAAVALATMFVNAEHVLEMEGVLPEAEEGFVIGNGDLSASVWPQGDAIVVRLGKGDVWDRRLVPSTFKPATQREYIDGLLKEKWTRTGWAKGGDLPYTVTGEKVLTDERRAEIACGTSRRMGLHAYPCPKPTGDFRLQLPRDYGGQAKWRTRLFVEEGCVRTSVAWKNGVAFEAEIVIPPEDNVLSVRWKLTGLTDLNRLGDGRHPDIAYTLSRHRDPPSYYAWLNRRACTYAGALNNYCGRGEDTEPLPPPTASGNMIEQRFPADPTFPDGFRYRLWLHADWAKNGRWEMPTPDGACVAAHPKPGSTEGWVQVVVRTSSDANLSVPRLRSHEEYAAAAKRAAGDYWQVSSVSIPGDRFLEDLWYATYHARRSILKPGTVPPGLFFPSTVQDYSWWHGDYHSNYNIQSVYWGDLTPNRLDDARTYFTLMKNWLTPIAKKIAREYYGCRGAFYQLEGVPIKLDDDLNGVCTFGRMAYMTGWMMSKYWLYYEYTRDRDWLRNEGYEVIRDVALFYLDFLKKAPSADLPPGIADGKYHVFPSNDGEMHPTGDAMKFCDRPANVAQARYALYAAIEAAKVLGCDAELRAAWQDRLDNLVGKGPELKGYEKHCFYACPPEMQGGGAFGRPYAEQAPRPANWNRSGSERSYFGHDNSGYVSRMRRNDFNVGADWPRWRSVLESWTHANYLAWAMPISDWGRAGAWTETLSAMAPLNEMLLQSWEGGIRLFPYWPKERDVAFRGFRAVGGFLVSAKLVSGQVRDFTIVSEKGELCRVHGDYSVVDAAGQPVSTSRDEFGRHVFATVAGGKYALVRNVTLFADGDFVAPQAQEATSATVACPNGRRVTLPLRKGEVRTMNVNF